MPKSLDQIVKEIHGCTRCGLHATRINIVIGEGPVDADIMVVGEAPGRQEDATGRPFYGSAGKNLSALMEECGLKREEVYIANIVKCRPIGPTGTDRRPKTTECEACIDYLWDQVEAIKPAVILAVGATAAQRLLGTKKNIKDLRDRTHYIDGTPVIVTYHTSGLGLNREPGRRDAVKDDIRAAIAISEESKDIRS